MKRLLIVVAILIVVTSAASANPDGWIDLFADSTHTSWCISVPPGVNYEVFHMYLIARPPVTGLRSYDLRIDIPDPAVSIADVTLPPNHSIPMGQWHEGMACGFTDCQTDPWVLCAQFLLVALPPGLQPGCQLIKLAPSYWYQGGPFEDDILFSDCEVTTLRAETQFGVYINCDPCPDIIATEEKSWGAIKSLYK